MNNKYLFKSIIVEQVLVISWLKMRVKHIIISDNCFVIKNALNNLNLKRHILKSLFLVEIVQLSLI